MAVSRRYLIAVSPNYILKLLSIALGLLLLLVVASAGVLSLSGLLVSHHLCPNPDGQDIFPGGVILRPPGPTLDNLGTEHKHHHHHPQSSSSSSGYSYGEGSEWDGLPGYLGPFHRCNKNHHGKRVFVTLLMTEPYLVSVLKLACSLRQVNSKYPLLVLHPSTISEGTLEILRSQGIETRETELITFPNSFADRFRVNWTKLRLWQLTEYSKIVYLDADTFVLQNVDELFDIHVPFAIPADTERQCYRCGPMGFNQAGVFVTEPCLATFADMMRLITTDSSMRFENSDSEQGFLNYYFQYQRYLLPPDYNFLCHQFWDTPLRDRAKVLHYTMQKPWWGTRKNYHDPWYQCYVPDVDPMYNDGVVVN